MELFLALAARVGKDYGFSAFVVALLMVLFFAIVTNDKLIRVADRVLNKSLRQTSLYRFMRLSIVLVFVFSITVVVLAFLAPAILRSTENTTLALTLEASEKFAARDYPAARQLYEKSLALNPDHASADEVRGMVTATYYTQGLHQEGLQFICKQYRHKPEADRSHLFGVHAHLRALGVKSGAAHAERVAQQLREQCGRPDFSEFWAHVPFGMMETLRTGKLRTEHGWELTADGQARLAALLEEKRQRAMTKQVPLADYVLYFLGRFDELISEMRQSDIRDMALFDAARFATGEARAAYLRKLVEEHPKSRRITDAHTLLVDTLATLGKRDEALMYAARLSTTQAADTAARLALAPTFGVIAQLISAGDFGAARTLAQEVCAASTKVHMPCHQELRSQIDKASTALAQLAAPRQNAPCVQVHSRLRALARTADKRVDPSWLHGSRVHLANCLDDLQSDPEQYGKALYLLASVSRRVGDYESSLKYLTRFEREIPEHDLLDDVFAELGYHKLVIERDWNAAKKYFDLVVSRYAGRNAYDNALWWYAKGLKSQGDYAAAMAAYAEIASLSAKSRFRDWSHSDHEALQRLSEIVPFTGVSLRARSSQDDALYIVGLSDTAPTGKFLAVGDRLVRVCGANVHNAEHLLGIVKGLEPAQPCKVLYLRGRTLLRLSGSSAAGWRGDSMALTPQDLRQLAYGGGEF